MNYVSVVAIMSHILYISICTLTCILSWLLSNENARYLCIVQLECEVDLLKVGHLSMMATNHYPWSVFSVSLNTYITTDECQLMLNREIGIQYNVPERTHSLERTKF